MADPERTFTDAEIENWCRQAAEGDSSAVEQLLWVYHQRFMSFTARKIGVEWKGKIETEDLLQEAYLRMFADIRSFVYQDNDAFYHWATRIIDHRFIDAVRHWRRQKRDVSREIPRDARSVSRRESLLDRCMATAGPASQIMRREEAVGAMMNCIAQLPEHYRLVVQQHYLEERPLSEIAVELDRSEDAVRRLASRAFEKLSSCLGRASHYLSMHG